MSEAKSEEPKSIILKSYPKIVFLYPTFIMAIAASVISYFLGEPKPLTPNHDWHALLGTVFLFVFALNMTVLAFDFPRTTSLTLFFLVMAVVLGLLLLFRFADIWTSFKNFLAALQPVANCQFYMLFSLILSMLYCVVIVYVRNDYWEVRANELLHHHGVLSNLERFSAPNLRISKEIDDVFEYMLLRSGRLILQPSNEPRSYVLDNVLFIDSKETAITKLLGSLQVQIRDDSAPPPPASSHF